MHRNARLLWQRRSNVALKGKKYVWICIIPAMLLIAMFLVYPLIRTVIYSFSSWYNFSPKSEWIGLDNYKRLLSDMVMPVAFRNTAILIVGVLIFQVGFALLLAIMVDSVHHGLKIFRTVYFFPIVISGTAIGLMFTLIYKYEYGLLNYIITLFGYDKQVWITPKTAIFLTLIPVLWQYIGFYFVIFLTGISKIPEDIYESAMLDGITPVKKIIYITIPMLKDVLISTIVLVVSGCFRVFDTVYVITKGGPMNASQLLSTYMYQMAFEKYNGGYASAIAIVMIIIGVLLTIGLRKLLKADAED